MDVRSVILQAGVATPQKIPFRFFMLIEAASPIDVEFLARNGTSKIGEVGRSVEAGYKKKPLDVTNLDESWGGFILTSATLQTVRVACSDSEGDYLRFAQLMQVEQPNALETAPDVTVDNTAGGVQVLAANTARRNALITNTSANNCRIGDGNVSATRGVQLAAGASITLVTTSVIRAIREGAANATLSVTTEVKQ